MHVWNRSSSCLNAAHSHTSQPVITKSSDVGKMGFLERENATILNAALRKLARRTVEGLRTALVRGTESFVESQLLKPACLHRLKLGLDVHSTSRTTMVPCLLQSVLSTFPFLPSRQVVLLSYAVVV